MGLAVLGLVALPAHAQTYYWQVQSGDWSVASNWGGSLPTTATQVEVANGGTATITSAGDACYRLYIDGNSAVRMLSGSLAASQFEFVGYSDSGSFSQSGGTNSLSNMFIIANSSSSSGTYTMTGGELVTTPSPAVVGYFGAEHSSSLLEL